MLNYEITNDPNAIKEFVVDKIAKIQVKQLDEESTLFLLELLSNRSGQIKIPEKEKPVVFRIIEKRIENCHSFRITDARLLIYLTYISISAGNAIMYLWYLQAHCKERNIDSLNLDDFCLNVFPWGLPPHEDLQTVWDGQKVKRPNNSFASDNLVDYSSAGESLQMNQTVQC